MTHIPPYPLQWPEGLPRTERREDSRMKATMAVAMENVRTSLRLFGQDTGKPVTNPTLSSNVGGLSLDDRAPNDPGIAVWFDWDDAQRCIAVDRYRKPHENLQAIHHIIEARRTEMRHGGLHIVRQTFKGFTALPAQTQEEWWRVLGFVGPKVTAPDIEAAYRARVKGAHPDSGGSHEAMARLNAARDAGLQVVK
jgi:hypothetical protein